MNHTYAQVQNWYTINIQAMLNSKDYGYAPNQGLGNYSEERYFEEMQKLVDEGYEIVRFNKIQNHYMYALKADLPTYITDFEIMKPTPVYEAFFHYANDYVYGMALQQA